MNIDGEFHMVVDYRELNKITVCEVFPTANIEENINHRPGIQMSHADALSRNPHEQASEPATLQRQDNNIKDIIKKLDYGKNDNVRKNFEKEYVLKNNRLFKKNEDGLRFFVPCYLRWKAIKSSHGDVSHEKCDIPFYMVHIYHVGPFPKSRKGNQYILGIIDAYTKFIMLRPVSNTTAKAVVQTLMDISKFVGILSQVVSHPGTSFTSNVFKSFCEENGIKHILTAVGTPRANGQIERYFRTVNVALSSMTENNDGRDWEQHVLAIQWGINSIEHKIYDDEEHIPLDKLRKVVKSRIDNEGKKASEIFNKKHRSPNKYSDGDFVLIKAEHVSTGQTRKLLARFKGNDRYLISDTSTSQLNQRKFESVQAAYKIKPWCNLFEFMEVQRRGEMM
ncbi:hypothetical protein CVS40_10329 [Lucilia cuprina]|nr:hypothetical protein CVS40_10329 [Lucilia cuprina]